MFKLRLILLAISAILIANEFASSTAQDLPSTYEYFREGGINEGLIAANKEFRLNGKYIKILSGGLHYFRSHPSQWRERLRQLRAMGANAVETYIAWNIHEPERDVFDFGDGSFDLSEFADIVKFVEIAEEEDLLVIIRPGPFICAEWDWGALPAWLMHGDPNLKIRQNYQPFLDRVKIFFDALLGKLEDYQFTRGRSIIAIQLENEYAAFDDRSVEYLQFIERVFNDNGFDESLYFTSDHNFGPDGYQGAAPGILQTANTHDPDDQFAKLQNIQPDMPLIAMEYYTGWATHWLADKWDGRGEEDYLKYMDMCLGEYNGSVNLYVYYGGTNFGFTSGANSDGRPPFITFITTSYDFDAIITEAGDYTSKFDSTLEMFEKYENPKLRKPERPLQSKKTAYPSISMLQGQSLTYNDLIDLVPSSHKVHLNGPAIGMEDIDVNNGNGQSYGYIVYRIERQLGSSDVVTVSWPRDFCQVLVDGEVIPTGLTDGNDPSEYWINSIKDIPLNMTTNVPMNHVVDIMIENMGRVNFGGANDLRQNKGLSPIQNAMLELNGQEIDDGLDVIALEFTNAWVKGIPSTAWRDTTNTKAPCAFRLTFNIALEADVTDTFLNMRDWHKGIVFVNGFNLGRYWKVGPQRSLYVPAALLKQGQNEIVVFEQVASAGEIVFSDVPLYNN